MSREGVGASEDRPRRRPALRKSLWLGLGRPSFFQGMPARKACPGRSGDAGEPGGPAPGPGCGGRGAGARWERGRCHLAAPGPGPLPAPAGGTPPTPPSLCMRGNRLESGGFPGVSASGAGASARKMRRDVNAVGVNVFASRGADPSSHGLLPAALSPSLHLSPSFRPYERFLLLSLHLKKSPVAGAGLSPPLHPFTSTAGSLPPPILWSRCSPTAAGPHGRAGVGETQPHLFSSFSYVFNSHQIFQGC